MYLFSRRFLSSLAVLFSVVLLQTQAMQAQQTLGGITGTVVDPSGSAVPDAEVKATSEETKLERSTRSNAQGVYNLNDLPLGKYTVTFTKEGFSSERYPGILVQADRTVSFQAQLKVFFASPKGKLWIRVFKDKKLSRADRAELAKRFQQLPVTPYSEDTSLGNM